MSKIGTIPHGSKSASVYFAPAIPSGMSGDKAGIVFAGKTYYVGFVDTTAAAGPNSFAIPGVGTFKVDQAATSGVLATSTKWGLKIVAAPAPAPTSTPAPVLGDIPNTANDVAVFDRSSLRKLTADYVLKAGERLSGVDTNGHSIKAVLAKGQTASIVDCLINGGYVSQDVKGDRYGVDCNGNLGFVTIGNCEITRCANAGVYGDNFLCIRSHLVKNGADASKPQHNATLEECYIEDVGMDNPGSHADGGQTESGSNVTYRRCNIHLVAGLRGGHTFKASQGIIFAARPGETSKGLLVDTCRIYCTNTGILAYTDSGDGSSITIQNCDIMAKMPIDAEKGAKLINNRLTRIG